MPVASETAQTRFGISGSVARRAGSFAGKASPFVISVTGTLATIESVTGSLATIESVTGTLVPDE